MKKIFTFCFFAFALLIGTQTAFAQDQASLKEKSYLKAKEIRSLIKFNDNTLEQVYDAFYANEKKLISIEDAYESGSEQYNQAIASSNKTLQTKIKKVLGTDLYKRYLIATNQEEIAE